MKFDDYLASLEKKRPGPGWSNALQALWHEARNDWHKAHELVQDNSPASCWVHAYLHRKEGDLSNARYWYDRAGQPEYEGDFSDEWNAIAERLVNRH